MTAKYFMDIANQIVNLKPKYRMETKTINEVRTSNDGWLFIPGKMIRFNEIGSVNNKGYELMRFLYKETPTAKHSFDFKHKRQG